MRFKTLKQLQRRKPYEVRLCNLPEVVTIDSYAKEKAYRINELVYEVHGEIVEWYGFTLATKSEPRIITDIGLPRNEENLQQHTSIAPEMIARYQETLPGHLVINGWIHSHGDLEFRRFSETDNENNITVLEFAYTSIKKQIAKKEVKIKQWSFLVENEYSDEDFRSGNACLITDVPITSARLFETVYGGFCFCLVIGNDGWHEQQIYYKKRGILTGESFVDKKEAELKIVDSGRKLSNAEISALEKKVRENIHPVTAPPPERLERM